MKSTILSTLTLSLALASTAFAGDLPATGPAALAPAPAAELLALRAGESAPVPAVAAAERTELSRAAASATDLDTLRAGDLNDHDLTVIGVVVGVVVLAILIF